MDTVSSNKWFSDMAYKISTTAPTDETTTDYTYTLIARKIKVEDMNIEDLLKLQREEVAEAIKGNAYGELSPAVFIEKLSQLGLSIHLYLI